MTILERLNRGRRAKGEEQHLRGPPFWFCKLENLLYKAATSWEDSATAYVPLFQRQMWNSLFPQEEKARTRTPPPIFGIGIRQKDGRSRTSYFRVYNSRVANCSLKSAYCVEFANLIFQSRPNPPYFFDFNANSGFFQIAYSSADLNFKISFLRLS